MPVDMSDENTTPADAPAPESHDLTPPAEGGLATTHTEVGSPAEDVTSAPTPTPEAAPIDASGEPESQNEAGGELESGLESGAETATPAEAAVGAEVTPEEGALAGGPESAKKWYVVKVQSGREESIKSAVERKMRIEGLEQFFGQIAIPTEDVVEKKKVKARVKDKKTGEIETVYQEKNVTKKRKKFPGYLFAEVEFNDQILYLFRETSGVGDFVGATHHRAPNPMSDRDVKAMLTGIVDKPAGPKVKVKLDFEKGDKVRIREGAFSGMEGDVKSITDTKDTTESPKVTVVVSIFGRPVDVELEYWQVDKV